MSETKAKLAAQVEQLRAKVAALQDVAEAADALLDDVGERTECYGVDSVALLLIENLQTAVRAARFAR